ncbi:MAG: DUF58 domain-containing protein [Candidatus Methylacidiphilales bacterium]|nr:DUF58 domain-containing protein [Candidatus Methylacidiphilales bacterium]
MQHSFLDPDAISRGEALGILARTVVEGYRVGEHKSPFRGFAIEFAQHREYTAGDDIRHLDWKVLGRSDRYYIKQYEQDTNFVAHLVLDGSSSMLYGSTPLTKLHFGKALAACLGYLVLSQRDAITFSLFDTETREYVQRTDSMSKIHHLMNRLAAFNAAEATRIGKALEEVSRKARSRGIVMIISDFMDTEEDFAKGMQRLRFTGQEVIVFHVLDPFEITFPFTGSWRFQGLEGEEEIKTSPADIRKAYLKNFDAFRTRIRGICEKFQAHYVLADTGKPLAEVLSGYLAFRSMVGKGGR